VAACLRASLGWFCASTQRIAGSRYHNLKSTLSSSLPIQFYSSSFSTTDPMPALRVSTCPYILLLDADERLDEHNLRQLAQLLGCETPPPPLDGSTAVVATNPGAATSKETSAIVAASDASPLPAAMSDSEHSGDEDGSRRGPPRLSVEDFVRIWPNRALDPTIAAPTTVCINFKITCVNSAGLPVVRSNSGLLNPRLFPNSPHFRFVNAVAKRFERLLFNGDDVPPPWMQRPGVIFLHYIPPLAARERKNKAYRASDKDSK
jgi:hypothetical protein